MKEKAKNEPLGSSGVGRDDDHVPPVLNVVLDPAIRSQKSQYLVLNRPMMQHPPNHARLGPKVVDGHLKESLNLRGMQVHGDDVIASGDLQHVGDELGRDGRARLVLAVLLYRAKTISAEPSEGNEGRGRTMREYGKQGMTAVILFALAVLQAEMRINSSINRSLGSLKGSGAGLLAPTTPCPPGRGVTGREATGVPGREISAPTPASP